MVEVKLKVQPRQSTSGSYKHRLRGNGKIPAVIYGKDMSNKLVEVDVRNLESILRHGAGRNTIINLTVEEAKPNKLTVMIKDLQRDPLKGELVHADLQKISLKDKVHTSVPVHFTGQAEGVKKGGIVQHGVRELDVESIPADLPDYINVDISALDIGDSLTVQDIVPEGQYLITNELSTVVVSITAPRMAEPVDEAPAEPEQPKPAEKTAVPAAAEGEAE